MEKEKDSVGSAGWAAVGFGIFTVFVVGVFLNSGIGNAPVVKPTPIHEVEIAEVTSYAEAKGAHVVFKAKGNNQVYLIDYQPSALLLKPGQRVQLKYREQSTANTDITVDKFIVVK